jgi:acyl-CoA thioester hydrolase
MSNAQIREVRERYRYFVGVTTRWMDNDLYGHVNNVMYYSYFDTAVNRFLIEAGELDIHESPVIGVAVESKCNFRSPLAYPEDLEVGVRADHISRRSVRYGIGVFRAGEDEAAASGYFVHVFVDRRTMKPVSIPAQIRTALESNAVLDPADDRS